LAKLDAMGPSSTVHDIQAATDQIRKDADAVQSQGGKIGTPTAKKFAGAANQLNAETRNIPENMTVAQVQARIKDDVQNVKQSAQALADESGCPKARPKDDTGGDTNNQPPSTP